MAFGGWFGQQASKAGQGIVDTVSDIGSSIDDAIINPIATTIGDAGESFEDEFDAALADETLGPIINVVAYHFGGPAAVAALKYKQTGEISDSLEAGAKAYIIANIASEVAGPSSDPNAVGSANGPDNIDVGGGYNPSGNYVNEQITSDISNAAADNIDAGGGWSPSTGATQAEYASARAAMASKGITFQQALNGVRAGLFVNSLVGDPLGLAGDQGGNAGSTGFAGFEMLPIPSTWQVPTYSAPSAPIDLSSIFSNQDMLGGTQWQGLQTQQPNISFNDIFAAGQQQTPMGTPVDINQIVSSILGQAATSQKPA